MSNDQPTSRPHRPVLLGANPAVQLFDDAGACTAYVSVWRVDWSEHGTGTALVLWRPSEVLVLGEDTGLSCWLAESFVRHFPEITGLAWKQPTVRRTPVHLDLDLATGMHARAGEITVHAQDVLDRRWFVTDDFTLGSARSAGLSLVLAPCRTGGISVADEGITGAVSVSGTPDRPSSSAFVTDAEVWRF